MNETLETLYQKFSREIDAECEKKFEQFFDSFLNGLAVKMAIGLTPRYVQKSKECGENYDETFITVNLRNQLYDLMKGSK